MNHETQWKAKLGDKHQHSYRSYSIGKQRLKLWEHLHEKNTREYIRLKE